jgi:hypothetical protein
MINTSTERVFQNAILDSHEAYQAQMTLKNDQFKRVVFDLLKQGLKEE